MKMKLNNKGFSMLELMLAMTILAIGLLAVAQLQVISLRGGATSRKLSTAINIANQNLESIRGAGKFLVDVGSGGALGQYNNIDILLGNCNKDNDAESYFAPAITASTDISALKYDTIRVIKDYSGLNGIQPEMIAVIHEAHHPFTTDITLGDFTVLFNIRNKPASASSDDCSDWPSGAEVVVSKDVNIIVLWKEGTATKSVSMRTIVGRKDNEIY